MTVAWGIVLLAVLLRVRFNNVDAFSRSDETTYLRHVHDRRPLREQLREHVADTPSPYRIGWTWTARFFRARTYGKLASLSTMFSIWMVVVAAYFARPGTEITTALLLAATPIGLAMGRRALQDSAVGCMVLLFFLLADRLLFWPALATGIVLASYKEAGFGFSAPAVVLLWWLRGGGIPEAAALFLVPPLVFGGLLLLVVRDFRLLWRTLNSTLTQSAFPYSIAYGQGPPHTYMVQWLILSPVAAIALLLHWSWTPLAIATAVYVALLSAPRFKNYRLFVGADALLRILAATALAAVPHGWIIAVVALLADFQIFRRVFVAGKVYDPVLYNMLRALCMIPV